MITWMSHPEHGHIPVYDTPTIRSNKENGWSVCEEPKPAVDVAQAPEPVKTDAQRGEDVDAELERRKRLEIDYERKFKKKPHHRMSIESIEAALKEGTGAD